MAPRPGSPESIVDRFDAMDETDYGDRTPNDEEEEVEQEDGSDEEEQETTQDDEGSEETSEAAPSRQQSASKDKKDGNAEQLRPAGPNHLQDSKGNLYDKAGNPVARAGSERRLFERNVRMQGELDARQQQITQLQQQLQQVGNVGEEPRRLGLDADDLRVGYPIIAEFKKDPVKAARNVLEMVMGMGHNLSDILGGNAKDAVEMGAISRLIDQRMAPLHRIEQSAARQEQETRLHEAARQEMARFFDEHEHSSVHADAIDNLLGRRPELTPEKAYYELRLFATQHGLDFSRPLAPQLANAQQQTQQNNRQPTRRSVPPMANGSRGNRQVALPDAVEVEATSTWDDIIRNTLRANRGN